MERRIILLFTATPVENKLMELYNLITLLKPGQLETATSFREKFMKRRDPTDPRNQTLLKKLLGQVMVKNLLAQAESSPKAVESTLTRMLENSVAMTEGKSLNQWIIDTLEHAAHI